MLFLFFMRIYFSYVFKFDIINFGMIKNIILKLLFFIFACIHFFIVCKYMLPFREMYNITQKSVYISASITGFIILTIFYQLILCTIKAFIEKNKSAVDFTKYTVFYFLLSLIFFVLTKPYSLSFHDCYYIIPYTDFYSVNWFQNLIANMLFIFPKYFYPSVFSTSIFCSFIYSLIFGYCSFNLKNKFPRLHFLAIIFFCLPMLLLFSLVQYTQVFASYLLCFILFYIYFNEDKNNKSLSTAILFGFVSAILIFIRLENISLIIILPLIVYLMKIFNKSSFIVYCLSVVMVFTPLFIVQKYNINMNYELHNLSFIFDSYKRANMPLTEYNNNKKIFQTVFPLIKETRNRDVFGQKIVTNDAKAARKARHLMFIMILKHPVKLIKYNIIKINEQIKHNDYLNVKLSTSRYDGDKTNYWMENIKYLKFKNKFISLCIYLNPNFKSTVINKKLYNPVNYTIFIFLCFLYGIIRRNKYFVLTSLFLTFIMVQMLLLMPIFQFFYFYPVIFTSPLLFLLMMFSIINDISFLRENN